MSASDGGKGSDRRNGKMPEGNWERAFSVSNHRTAPKEDAKEEPDAYCVTTPDGGCASTDSRCMHQQPVNLK
jgi:hypothetical protein